MNAYCKDLFAHFSNLANGFALFRTAASANAGQVFHAQLLATTRSHVSIILSGSITMSIAAFLLFYGDAQIAPIAIAAFFLPVSFSGLLIHRRNLRIAIK
jgi:hypothetical protein